PTSSSTTRIFSLPDFRLPPARVREFCPSGGIINHRRALTKSRGGWAVWILSLRAGRRQGSRVEDAPPTLSRSFAHAESSEALRCCSKRRAAGAGRGARRGQPSAHRRLRRGRDVCAASPSRWRRNQRGLRGGL